MPTSKPTHCPDAALLQRFLDEHLGESEEAGVQEHLDSCTTCQGALERVAGEPALWSDLRAQLARAPFTGTPFTGPPPTEEQANATGSELEDLTELLGPTDDPTMLGRVGSYEVRGLIGRGTTGLVLKALEPRLGRFVAIKLMSPGLTSNGSARRRFEREGRAIAAVSHEHVVPIYAVDEHRGLPYIVMKYIPGLSLEQRIEQDGPLDTCAVARVGLQVAQGLAAAHAQGIVHRDVKPANVILEETVERAMVTDFGLARVADEASMTRSGTLTGTPQFMSPEQARGDVVDARSDLFSLGGLMYAACTGRPPFRSETVYGVINRVCEAQPRPIREINPAIDEWLASFIDKLMSKRPEDRFQSAAEVADALAGELAHLQNPAASPRPLRAWLAPAIPAPARRSPTSAAAALLAVLALTAGAVVLSHSEDTEGTGERGDARASVLTGITGLGGRPESEPASTPPHPEQAFEQQQMRTFPVGDAISLTFRVARGDIELAPGEPGEVRVTVLRPVAEGAAEPTTVSAASHLFELQREGDGLSLSASLPAQAATDALVPVLFRVVIPSDLVADVRTTYGSISIGPLASDVRAEAHGGNIRFALVDGAIWARTEDGAIDVSEGCTGHAEIFAVGGDVHLAHALTSARIRTSNGDVYLGESTGAVTAQTSGGDVSIDGIAGPTDAHAEDGNVFARLTEDPGGSAELSATHGNVTIQLSEQVAATIEASGRLETSLPFETEGAGAGQSWSVSRVNGGGARIRASSTTGTLAVAWSDDSESLGGSGLGGSGLGGSGLGGSGLGGSGLGGSGLGGSGQAHAQLVEHTPQPSGYSREKTSGSPRPGALVTVALRDPVGNMDGYTLYLPVSHDSREGTFPVLVYLQGAYGVGGPIGDLNNWGLPRLLRDESDLSSERNRLLLDEFIVVSPHIRVGQYFDEAPTVEAILDHVLATYKADPERIYLTGLSRGGHGTWGLGARLPHRFAALAPVGGNPQSVGEFGLLVGASIWIAHNRSDGIVPFALAADAALRIEEASDLDFLRTDASNVAGTNYLKRKFVLTSTPNGGHDAWTDLYSNPEFYRWLLRQRLTDAPAAPQSLAPDAPPQQPGAPDALGANREV